MTRSALGSRTAAPQPVVSFDGCYWSPRAFCEMPGGKKKEVQTVMRFDCGFCAWLFSRLCDLRRGAVYYSRLWRAGSEFLLFFIYLMGLWEIMKSG